MIENIWSVMGVYAVTVVILLWIIKWLVKEISKKDDKLMEMLPALTRVQETMGEIARISSDLLATIAVLQDRNHRNDESSV